MISLKKEDSDFLFASTQFCGHIENYIGLLGLNGAMVDAYIAQNELVIEMMKDKQGYGPETDHFISVTIENLKVTFTYLVMYCKASRHYNMAIGSNLGVEKSVEAMYTFPAN